ncbi:MAG: class I SAM-dependent methyltransferase [Candidatus Bathyarchaeia archaeon]
MPMLDVGCGMRKHKGCIGIDMRKMDGVDIVADARMLPFKDNCFDKIFLSHIIEHIEDLVSFMKEIWRVSKSLATVSIWTPHFTAYRSYADVTHKHHMTSQSFDYFDQTTTFGKFFWLTKEFGFKVKKKQIIFPKRTTRFWNYLIERLANQNPVRYEGMLGWIFPAENLYFELEVVK